MLMHRLLECINSHRVSWCNRYKSRWSNLISPLYRKLPKMSVIFPWDTIAGCPQKHQMWLQSVIKKYIEINEETLPREDQTTFDSLALQTKIFSWKRQYKFGTFFCAPSSICKLYAFNSWSQQMCIGYTTLLWQCGFNGPVINELTYLLTMAQNTRNQVQWPCFRYCNLFTLTLMWTTEVIWVKRQLHREMNLLH